MPKRHPEEFRQEAVRVALARDPGVSLAQVPLISESMWRAAMSGGAKSASSPENKNTSAARCCRSCLSCGVITICSTRKTRCCGAWPRIYRR